LVCRRVVHKAPRHVAVAVTAVCCRVAQVTTYQRKILYVNEISNTLHKRSSLEYLFYTHLRTVQMNTNSGIHWSQWTQTKRCDVITIRRYAYLTTKDNKHSYLRILVVVDEAYI